MPVYDSTQAMEGSLFPDQIIEEVDQVRLMGSSLAVKRSVHRAKGTSEGGSSVNGIAESMGVILRHADLPSQEREGLNSITFQRRSGGQRSVLSR